MTRKGKARTGTGRETHAEGGVGERHLVLQEGPVLASSFLRPSLPRKMDYSDYPHQPSHPSRSSPQRAWPPPVQQQQVPFPSPVSPGTFYFPPQTQPGAQTSPSTASRPTTSGLSLNLSGLSVASPPSLSPIGPHHAQLHPHQLHALRSAPHQPRHSHSHSHSSGSSISPITPVSPPSMPHIPAYNFDDPLGGLSPARDPQRRPSTGSRSPSSELAPEKSVPRKRSLTNTLPVSGTAAHGMHQHSQSHSYSSQTHALPHPIITTTASSPPLPSSSASSPSSHPSHSHSHSLSHSHSHSSLSQSLSPQPSHPQLEFNANTSPYDELDGAGPGFTGISDDPSDDDSVSPSGSCSVSGPFGESISDYSSIARPHCAFLSSTQCRLESIRVVEPTRAERHGQVCRHQ
jgi:hypothetical protein